MLPKKHKSPFQLVNEYLVTNLHPIAVHNLTDKRAGTTPGLLEYTASDTVHWGTLRDLPRATKGNVLAVEQTITLIIFFLSKLLLVKDWADNL